MSNKNYNNYKNEDNFIVDDDNFIVDDDNFIVDDDDFIEEDDDFIEEDDDELYIPKKKRRASESDIGSIKKKNHFLVQSTYDCNA